jgi:hypothetical protein
MRLGNDDELGFRQAKGETGATDLELDGATERSAPEHGTRSPRNESHVDEAFSDLSPHAELIDHEGKTVMNLVEGHGPTLRAEGWGRRT